MTHDPHQDAARQHPFRSEIDRLHADVRAEEAKAVAASERVFAALAVYDEWMAGKDPGDPEAEVHAFEAMKAAIAKADALATGAVSMNVDRPIVTTLCGSSRFPDAFSLANMHLSLMGRIVIGLTCYGHADQPTGAQFLTSDGDETALEKQALDQLHFRKINISDGVFVVNPGGYVGSSTKREIAYARSLGKTVEWLFPAGPTS